jgi:hypothetical protein
MTSIKRNYNSKSTGVQYYLFEEITPHSSRKPTSPPPQNPTAIADSEGQWNSGIQREREV